MKMFNEHCSWVLSVTFRSNKPVISCRLKIKTILVMIKPNSPNRQISGPHGYIKLQQTVQTTIFHFSGCLSPKYLVLKRFLIHIDFVHLEIVTNVELSIISYREEIVSYKLSRNRSLKMNRA